MKLKNYQQSALKVLSKFLEDVFESGDVASVFENLCRDNGWVTKGRAVYHDRFVGAPSVCIRIPTGGGKTLVAAASIKVVDDTYLQTGGCPLVLWLTPSDTITDQTLKSLSGAGHPYRNLLEADFKSVKAIGIDELPNLSPSDFEESCIIVVANVQTFNITDTDKRKVYAYREDLSAHFVGLSGEELNDLEKVTVEDKQLAFPDPVLVKHNVGEIKHSIVNLLRLHRPYIIVDEAHNNRTERFFDTLNRLGPRAMLELTATPTERNNVIYQVSAWELKADQMIKLPVILSEYSQTGWEACVDKTVVLRQDLENQSASEKQYIRPIALIQAQKKGGEPSPEQVRQYLIESHHISEASIAIATGSQKDLDGKDLFSPTCPIRFVITIQALKEGWDCSFAYVLCGLQNIQSAKDIEQLLGRVLRMPYATKRTVEALNCAYANIMSEETMALASTLKERMVQTLGFDKMEASSFLEMEAGNNQQQLTISDEQPSLFSDDHEAQYVAVRVAVSKKPDVVKNELAEAGLGASVRIATAQPSKGVIISVNADLSKTDEEKLKKVLLNGEEQSCHEIVGEALSEFHNFKSRKAAIHNQRRPFPEIPLLCFQDADDNECRVLEKSSGLPEMWNPSSFGVELKGFTPKMKINTSRLDVNKFERLQYQYVQADAVAAERQETIVTIKQEDLIYWLERQVGRNDVSSSLMTAFISKVVNECLIGELKMKLSEMLQARVQIANAIKRLLEVNYDKACKAGFQQQLKLVCPTPEDDIYQFRFDQGRYTPRRIYNPMEGNYDFTKHFYPEIHDLHAKTPAGKYAEEFLCAVAIDSCAKVKRWIRNIESSPYSFRLPTSDGYFYPDFVAELVDGRILVVEYKGEDRTTNDDSKEKRLMGETWERNSNGKGLFLWATIKDELGRNVEAQIMSKTEETS